MIAEIESKFSAEAEGVSGLTVIALGRDVAGREDAALKRDGAAGYVLVDGGSANLVGQDDNCSGQRGAAIASPNLANPNFENENEDEDEEDKNGLVTSSPTGFAQAAGMRPAAGLVMPGGVDGVVLAVHEENSGGQETAERPAVIGAHGTNGACVMPEEGKERESVRGGEREEGGNEDDRKLMDGGIGEPPEEWRISEANRRKGVLEAYDALLLQGRSKAAAAREVATGYTTIWRWQQRMAVEGFNGLLPETERCGRKDTWTKLGISAEQKEQILAEMKGLNLDTASVTASLRLFAQSDRCPEGLAAVILDPNRCSKHALPPSLRRAAEVNVNQRKAHRGPRALSLGGIWTPRRMDIMGGDIFSSDDTTPIWGFWVPWVESKDYPFGVKLLQGQLLPVIDVGSQAIITDVLIARETSSYRASDIWHLFGHTFDQVGLPRLGWQLERGSWESNIIRGVDVEYRDREVTMERRIGGLRQLPTNWTSWHREKLPDVPFPKTLQTWTSFLPKSKSIEGWFKRNQTFEGTLWGALGSDQQREPFEKAKKIFEACRRGAADPRLHFLSITELMERLNGIIGYVNSEPMEGEVFKGVPMQQFEAAVKDYPLYQMPEELKYLYRREWSLATVTGGWARVRLTHASGERYSLFYINPEVFAEIEGKQVAVYYDRENFERAAQVVAASDMVIRGEAYGPGEFVCEAQYEERRGSFLSGDASGHDIRKRWKNAVLSVYGTLVKHAPSRQVPVEVLARRAEAKKERETGKERESVKGGERESVRLGEGLSTVDGRPALVAEPVRGAVDMGRQRSRLAMQAQIAARLRAARGEEEF